MIIPAKLQIGDNVGIISPSFGGAGAFSHRYQQADESLNKIGLKVKPAKNALKSSGYVSSSIKDRVDDIHEMFSDPSVSAIICSIGGNHSNQLLQYLDYDLIAKNPKPFIGYSDITVLHYALLKFANLQTFYGPCLITQFGEYPEVLDFTLDHFVKALFEREIGTITPSKFYTDEFLDWSLKLDLSRARTMTINKGYEWADPGYAKGKIIGGCLGSLNHLLGTKYWIDPTEKIFFLDIPESEPGKGMKIPDVDAYLTDLDNCEVFSVISGLIVGRLYGYSAGEELLVKTLLRRFTSDKPYPVLLDVDFGHTDPIITIPYLAQAEINSANNSFSIDN